MFDIKLGMVWVCLAKGRDAFMIPWRSKMLAISKYGQILILHHLGRIPVLRRYHFRGQTFTSIPLDSPPHCVISSRSRASSHSAIPRPRAIAFSVHSESSIVEWKASIVSLLLSDTRSRNHNLLKRNKFMTKQDPLLSRSQEQAKCEHQITFSSPFLEPFRSQQNRLRTFSHRLSFLTQLCSSNNGPHASPSTPFHPLKNPLPLHRAQYLHPANPPQSLLDPLPILHSMPLHRPGNQRCK